MVSVFIALISERGGDDKIQDFGREIGDNLALIELDFMDFSSREVQSVSL